MPRRWGWDLNQSRAVPEPTVLQDPFWKIKLAVIRKGIGGSEGWRMNGEGWEVDLEKWGRTRLSRA